MCLLTAHPESAQTTAPLLGVWKITEVVFPDRSNGNPQPSLIVFTRGYYSRVSLEGRAPRSLVERPKDPQNPTAEEKIALYEHWRPLTASAGTYAVRGSTLILESLVAKNAAVMDRAAATNWEIKVEGSDVLWLIPSADRSATEPRMKLQRLE
ncbi:MAG TPA: hypothetical protein VJP86_14155 [Vicinamibacterales bacterium]|jgi:hypothetical protein|nr:hypothetical protein [Vicinamibacterales bacterium]